MILTLNKEAGWAARLCRARPVATQPSLPTRVVRSDPVLSVNSAPLAYSLPAEPHHRRREWRSAFPTLIPEGLDAGRKCRYVGEGRLRWARELLKNGKSLLCRRRRNQPPTEPFLNNQHIVEPTLFCLKNLARKKSSGAAREWMDPEGNLLLRQ